VTKKTAKRGARSKRRKPRLKKDRIKDLDVQRDFEPKGGAGSSIKPITASIRS
jgi:hypothetical protein